MQDIFTTIRSSIVAKIKSDADKIASTYPSDRSVFESFPSAIVTPSESIADYSDSSMDQMDIGFTIRVHQPIAQDGQTDADSILDGVVDQLLTIFTQKNVLGIACDWVLPVPSVWGYQDRESGPMRTAEIRLKCRKYIDKN